MRDILIIPFSILLLIHDAFCILRNCSDENEANKICMNGSSQNFPAIKLNTTLFLDEIVEINEEKNSITIRMGLYNKWKDSRLAPSSKTNL